MTIPCSIAVSVHFNVWILRNWTRMELDLDIFDDGVLAAPGIYPNNDSNIYNKLYGMFNIYQSWWQYIQHTEWRVLNWGRSNQSCHSFGSTYFYFFFLSCIWLSSFMYLMVTFIFDNMPKILILEVLPISTFLFISDLPHWSRDQCWYSYKVNRVRILDKILCMLIQSWYKLDFLKYSSEPFIIQLSPRSF